MENKVQFPLLSEAISAISETGEWSRSITPKELESLMLSVVKSIINEKKSIDILVNKMNVNIKHDGAPRVDVIGALAIVKPIQANIDLAFIFVNNCNGKGITLKSHCVEEKTKDFVAKIALGAVKLQDKVAKALANVNEALFNLLRNELAEANVVLNTCDCYITEDKSFFLHLKGSKR